MLRSIISDRRGANTIEYAVLVGLLALVVLAAVKVLGSNLRDKVNSHSEQVSKIGS